MIIWYIQPPKILCFELFKRRYRYCTKYLYNNIGRLGSFYKYYIFRQIRYNWTLTKECFMLLRPRNFRDVSFTEDPLARLRSGVRECVCQSSANRGTRRPECNSNKKQSRIQLQGRSAVRRFAVSSTSKVTSKRFDYRTRLRTRRTIRQQLI